MDEPPPLAGRGRTEDGRHVDLRLPAARPSARAEAAGDAGLTDVVSFVYLLFLGWLILAGPRSVSLDTLVAHRLDRPSRQAEAH
jgi:hypothetical protein